MTLSAPKTRLACLAFFAVVAMALAAFAAAPAHAAQKLEVTFLNVGQGDSTYVEMPNGSDILIDAGKTGQGATVVSKLKAKERGMDLEAVILTHPDADHAGGLIKVFANMKVKKFYYPQDAAFTTQTAKKVLNAARNEPGCKIYKVAKSNKKIVVSGNAYIQLIQGFKNYSSTNADSLMCHIHYKNFDAGVFGDVEGYAQTAGLKKNLDWLLMPHHGSAGASSDAFIDRYDPERLVISVGKNSYGHPAKAALNRYKNHDRGIKVFRTDRKGDITVKSGGSSWTVNKTGVAIANVKPGSAGSSGSSGVSGATGGGTGKTVYYTATGSKYHYAKSCRGLSNANAIYSTTLSNAKAKGLTLCGWED